MGKKMKKKGGRPKKAGRSAPKSPKKPFRLEVGKTYETAQGDMATVVHDDGSDWMPLRVKWITGPKLDCEFWQQPDGRYWDNSEPSMMRRLRLIREIRRDVPDASSRPRPKGGVKK